MAANDNNDADIGRTRVLRFEFSDALTAHLAAFAKMHQYDDRKTYKEAWTEWMANDEIATLFNAEAARLKCLGYNGDIADKLYKSGRYYFRGSHNNANANANANEMGKKRGSGTPRTYVLLTRELLNEMDEHIERGLRQDNTYTPAKGFIAFVQLNIESYTRELARLSEVMPTGEDVINKLKKTYKNRYFIMTKAVA
jgi:hypothetical protein